MTWCKRVVEWVVVVVVAGEVVVIDESIGGVGESDLERDGTPDSDMVGRCSADMRGGGGGIPEVVMRPVRD